MSSFAQQPSIAVIGSGAIGSYYGARLAQAGLPVHFLLRSDYEHVREHGLKIRSIAGDFELPAQSLHVYRSTNDMPKVDLVLVTLKSTDNAALADLIPPLLHDRTAILTLQNGLGNEDHLANLFGTNRILGGVAFTCINRISPGVISHIDHGHIRLGEFGVPEISPRAQQIADLFDRAQIPTTAVANILEVRWSKLTWNIPFNGLTTLLDVPTDQLIATPGGVALITAIIKEVVAIAAVTGIYLPLDIAEKQVKLTQSMGPYLTSTQLDRRQDRPMELDAIFSRPLAIAKSKNLPVPLLEFLDFSLRIINSTSVIRTS